MKRNRTACLIVARQSGLDLHKLLWKSQLSPTARHLAEASWPEVKSLGTGPRLSDSEF